MGRTTTFLIPELSVVGYKFVREFFFRFSVLEMEERFGGNKVLHAT